MLKKPEITIEQYDSLYQLYEQSQKQIEAMTTDFEKEKEDFKYKKVVLQKFIDSEDYAVINLKEVINKIESVSMQPFSENYNKFYELDKGREKQIESLKINNVIESKKQYYSSSYHEIKTIPLLITFLEIIKKLKQSNKENIKKLKK